MTLTAGDQKPQDPSKRSARSGNRGVHHKEELKGLKEKVDLLIKEVKNIMDRMHRGNEDG